VRCRPGNWRCEFTAADNDHYDALAFTIHALSGVRQTGQVNAKKSVLTNDREKFPRVVHPPPPGWREGCIGCSFKSDHIDGARTHLEITTSRSSPSRAHPSRRSRPSGDAWAAFRWVSSYGNDFNYDFHLSFSAEEIATGKVYYNYALHPFESEELVGDSVFVGLAK
jgi:predicted dithiol-disulfide oxidoreductase (DUF899 family)